MVDWFNQSKYMPKGHCLLWQPELTYLHVVGDIFIFVAYMIIPLFLIFMFRKAPSVPFKWVFIMFSLFIVISGLSHLANAFTVWYPIYWISGGLKALTAAVSVSTALLFVPLLKTLPGIGKEPR